MIIGLQMKGTATEDLPPNNAHFDANARIKNVPKVTPMPSRSTLDAAAIPTATRDTQLPGPTSQCPPGSGSGSMSVSDMVQLLLIQQLRQQQQQLDLHFQLQYQPSAMLPFGSNIVCTEVPTRSLPSSPSTLPKITLDTFCDHYKISDEDKARLAKLGYTPGNRNIKMLDRTDWKDDAGFAALTWKSMLEAHDRFMADVKKGLWNWV
jgi:hypothetical protein